MGDDGAHLPAGLGGNPLHTLNGHGGVPAEDRRELVFETAMRLSPVGPRRRDHAQKNTVNFRLNDLDLGDAADVLQAGQESEGMRGGAVRPEDQVVTAALDPLQTRKGAAARAGVSGESHDVANPEVQDYRGAVDEIGNDAFAGAAGADAVSLPIENAHGDLVEADVKAPP